MTKDNWLTVAMVIAVIITAAATLLGPVLAVYVQSRISQPKPAPDVTQPKDRIQDPGWLKRLPLSWISAAFSLIGVLAAIYLLLWEFRKTTPLTRWSVLTIAYGMSLILYNFMQLVVSFNLQSIYRMAETLAEAINKHAGILNKHAETINKQTDFAENVVNLLQDRKKDSDSN